MKEPVGATQKMKMPEKQSGSPFFRKLVGSREPSYVVHPSFVPELTFLRLLRMERKRSERSRKPFLLVLIELGASFRNGTRPKALPQMISSLCGSVRDTDTMGWYKENHAIGGLFCEFGMADKNRAVRSIQQKVIAALMDILGPTCLNQLQLSFVLFPEEHGRGDSENRINTKLYPDLSDNHTHTDKATQLIKRFMDITGSGLALLLLSPLFVLIAAAIKLTSEGPVLFRQERIGKFGEKFVFLKFRSMRVENDHSIHRNYVKQFIAGKTGSGAANNNPSHVYKITRDPRVTAVGRFLRKTSMDELPQFWNVFKGEMSLVGPRPPIPYEFEDYDIWHRRRVLEVKPGITGLWQVSGRSRMTFDEMVRLDLKYVKRWSPWLDIKILLQTPAAVLRGAGAY